MAHPTRRNNRLGLVVAIAALAALVGFGIVAAVMRGTGERAPADRNAATANATNAADEAARTDEAAAANANSTANANTNARAVRPTPDEDSTFLALFGVEENTSEQPIPQKPKDWLTTFASVTIRLTLAALLSAMLAFRPRRFALHYKRNPFVSQTQILLAVVASALMMIVGDSAARAFGIFAAVSLVRFRTNIRDPKEITVLLLSLAIGLATGVGRWELAVILAFFVLLLLWGLEYREPEQVFRSMSLEVKTRNVDATQEVLQTLFRKYNFDAEMRQLDRQDDDGDLGCVVYYVNVSPLVSTDRLSEEILTSDPQNVDSVEWGQLKESSYFYQ